MKRNVRTFSDANFLLWSGAKNKLSIDTPEERAQILCFDQISSPALPERNSGTERAGNRQQ